jgi:hypothetical protein
VGDHPLTEHGLLVLRANENGARSGRPRRSALRDYREGENGRLPRRNPPRLADDVAVLAMWTQLDDVWIGTWVEESVEYLFTLHLPG